MIEEINNSLKKQTDYLLNHPLYHKISRPEHLRCFMEHHVFAVWDCMSLLKALQQRLTHTNSPWIPVGTPEIRYLINKLVLAEETDTDPNGKRLSHFEMYLKAMDRSGTNREKIENFLLQITHGTDIFLVIAVSDLPISIKKFLKFTFEIIDEGKPHKIAAAFSFGREGLIPGRLSSLIKSIQQKFPDEDLDLLKYYFEGQTALDADEHGSLAFRMVESLCGDDPDKWQEVKETAAHALEIRTNLWNGIEEEISEKIMV